MPTIDEQIDTLHDLRERIAGVAKEQATMDLEGRTLRLTIETELRTGGTVKTDAEKLAKADERYLTHERHAIQLSFDRAVLEADAESDAYGIQLQLALLRREAVGA